MTALSFQVPEVGLPDKTEEPKITNALKAILAWAQASIDSTNIEEEGIEDKNLKKGTITSDKLAEGNWTKPALEHSWINYGGEYAEAGYMKDAAGIIRLHGVLRGGVSGTVAFTLPEGFRPTAAEQFPIAGTTNLCKINAKGEVLLNGNTVSEQAPLSGISFPPGK